MNPIDAVRKEIAWGTDCNAIDGTDEAKCNWPLRCICHEAAVKALLALAEVELPEEAIESCAEAYSDAKAESKAKQVAFRETYGITSSPHNIGVAPAEWIPQVFRAILRSLAGDLFQITAEPTIPPSGHQKPVVTSGFLSDLGKLNSAAVRVGDAPEVSIWEGLRPAVRVRLSQAVDHLLKTGSLNRADIERIGEVSTPQASADINEIQNRLPHLMRYDPSAKRYVLASAPRSSEEERSDDTTAEPTTELSGHQNIENVE